MKISYDWLKEFIDLNISPEKLAECFNQIGLMVESVEKKAKDTIYDIETYANRPDTLGHLGVAREIATLLGLTLKSQKWPLNEVEEPTSELIDIQIMDSHLCPRYCGLVVKGIKVGPSPEWLKNRVEAVGLRSINNIVDISNYVCFALGQPLHTFDLNKIGGAKIIVRKALKGERIKTLDGSLIELDTEMLVIADEARPLAIAGIIGGEDSGITEETRDIFIESANFDPVSIRLTAKKLAINTDASYRFERGVDINCAPQAAIMAASLLGRFGGKVSKGLLDVYPNQKKIRTVSLRLQRITELLGVEIPADFVIRTLTGLGLKLKEQKESVWTVEIPSFRVDLEREADLIEEVARFYGYDQIPSEVTPVKYFELPSDQKREKIWRLKEVLFHQGFDEVINFSFVDPEKEKLWQTGLQAIHLQNPISSRASALRTSLLPGLIENAVWNFNHEAEGSHIFEVGNIYFWAENETHQEVLHLGILTCGIRPSPVWNEPGKETDFFFLKGAVEEIISYLGFNSLTFESEDHPFFEQGQSLKILLKNDPIGYLGRLKSQIAQNYELGKAAFAAEISLKELLEKPTGAFIFKPVPKFPGISRDLSFLVEEDLTYQRLQQQLQKLNIPYLEEFKIYDRFQGKTLPPGKISFSVRFFFRHQSRTLQAAEVDQLMLDIITQLKSSIKIQLR